MKAAPRNAQLLPATAFVARACVGLLGLLIATNLMAQVAVLRTRDVAVNGRTVQEIRLANVPGTNRLLMRMVVLTNGPTAGTTTLLTAVADINDWVDTAAPAPVFTEVIASGTAFSVGGGCQRGNQLDFPFINTNQPQVLRFVGGSSTIVPLGVGTESWDSADCTVSGDGTRTVFLFTARTLQRGYVFIDTGAANDLLSPQVSVSQLKTPFEGGLRPAISTVPGTARKVTLLFMQTNGQTRWWQYDPDPINVDFNCLVGTQTPAPSGFTIPRGAKVANREAIADLDGDGDFEVVHMSPGTPPNCTKTPAQTPAGPVAGSNFNWTEPGVAIDPESGQINFLAGTYTSVLANGATTSTAGNAVGGSAAACAASNTERLNQVVTAHPVGPSAQQIEMQQRQLNDAIARAANRVILKGGFESDNRLIELFCAYFGGF